MSCLGIYCAKRSDFVLSFTHVVSTLPESTYCVMGIF